MLIKAYYWMCKKTLPVIYLNINIFNEKKNNSKILKIKIGTKEIRKGIRKIKNEHLNLFFLVHDHFVKIKNSKIEVNLLII
jgi:hypothetical protein